MEKGEKTKIEEKDGTIELVASGSVKIDSSIEAGGGGQGGRSPRPATFGRSAA